MTIICLIKIRFSQIFREIKDAGIFRAIFLIAVITPLLLLFLYKKLPEQRYDYAIPIVAILLIFIVHRNRKDYFFLSKISKSPVWIFFVEYFVFSAPLLGLLIFFGLNVQALMYIVLLAVICFIKPSPKGSKTKTYSALINYIPVVMFEWRSGIRTNLLVIIFLYGLGLAGIFNIWLAVVSLALLSLIFSTFYGVNESQKILIASEQKSAIFLCAKIGQHVKYWALFLLPLLLIAFVHYQNWMLILAAFFAAINLMIFAILVKYTYYRPSSTVFLSQLITSIAWLFSIILPISIFVFLLNIYLYIKAKHNLNYYLDA